MESSSIGASSLPWWGWFILAFILWIAQFFAEGKKEFGFWRIMLIVAMILSFLTGLIRFVRWVWTS